MTYLPNFQKLKQTFLAQQDGTIYTNRFQFDNLSLAKRVRLHPNLAEVKSPQSSSITLLLHDANPAAVKAMEGQLKMYLMHHEGFPWKARTGGERTLLGKKILQSDYVFAMSGPQTAKVNLEVRLANDNEATILVTGDQTVETSMRLAHIVVALLDQYTAQYTA